MKLWKLILGILFLSIPTHARRSRESGRDRVSARLEESVAGKKTDRSADNRILRENTATYRHPCAKVRCSSGKECSLNRGGSPKCVCISECPNRLTIEDSVCGTDNKTYESECALRKLKCIGSPDRSVRKTLKRLKVNYLGPCKELTKCSKAELREYPARMRAWLKNVFLQMYDTLEEEGGLSEKQRFHGRKVYLERSKLQDFEEEGPHELMEKEFQKFYPLYKYPIHWKFGVLDRKRDGKLTKRELEPLRAPLIPMEHCTKPFFKQADKNRNKKISLEEWGAALGLSQDDIDPRLVF